MARAPLRGAGEDALAEDIIPEECILPKQPQDAHVCGVYVHLHLWQGQDMSDDCICFELACVMFFEVLMFARPYL